MKYAEPSATGYDRYVDDVLAPEDIHDASMVTSLSADNSLFLLVAILMAVLHGFNLYLFLGSDLPPLIGLVNHLIISAAAALLAYIKYRKGKEVQYLALLAIISSVTGVIGALGAVFGYLSSFIFAARAQHFRDWYSSIFPADLPSAPQSIYDSIMEGIDENPHSYSVMPFTDVMRLGSRIQKRRALAKMTSRFNPRFSGAFRIALADTDNNIRVQAATAIAKVEKRFAHRLERIEMARTREPNNSLLLMALASFYDDYAFTGILDSDVEHVNRERAISTYQSYLQQNPDSQEAWLAVGRLLYRNRQWEQATDWFRTALDRKWTANNMLLWYFECLFRLGRYRDLRRAILEYGRSIVGQEELPVDVRHAVLLWMQVA